MGFCYELETGCCDTPIRNTVCTALCHFMIFGIFVVSFVFSNTCYPPFYFVDYYFGGCGAALVVVSFLTACVVDLKKYQWLRSILSLLTILVVLATGSGAFYYTIERWDDVIVTALVLSIRRSSLKEQPDIFWFVLAVLACIQIVVFLIYLIYITSFMCNRWRSYLFTNSYINNEYMSAMPATVGIPADVYSTRQYKPYPTQRFDNSLRTN